MKRNSYEEYKYNKSLLEGLTYLGYPLHLVVGSYLGLIIWKSNRRQIIKSLLLNFKGAIKLKSMDIIVTYSIKRNDYDKLLNAYFPSIEKQNVDVGFKKGKAICGLFYSIYFLLKALFFTSKIKCSISHRIYLVTSVSIAFKVIKELESQQVTCQKYVAFNSSYLIESFLCFYFKKRGIPTYSLQHGMYFNFIGEIPYDVINVENCCADTLLLWGDYSYNEIKDIVPNFVDLKVVGNPLIVDNNLEKKRSTKVYVLLPRINYWNESKVLLDILANKKEESFIIRPHPSIKNEVACFVQMHNNMILDKYESSFEGMANNDFKAVISFNSTSIFEAIALKQHVLYFNLNSEIDFSKFNHFNSLNSLLFSSASQLNGKYYYNKFDASSFMLS